MNSEGNPISSWQGAWSSMVLENIWQQHPDPQVDGQAETGLVSALETSKSTPNDTSTPIGPPLWILLRSFHILITSIQIYESTRWGTFSYKPPQVTYWNTGEGMFTRVDMIQRQLHHQRPLQSWWQLTEAGNSAQPARSLESVLFKWLSLWQASRQLDWFLLLQGCCWSSLRSSMQLSLSESDPQESLLLSLGRSSLVSLNRFRDFLKLVEVIFWFKEVPHKMECFHPRENCCPIQVFKHMNPWESLLFKPPQP